MKKIEINPQDLQDWMGNTWHVYASQVINKKRLNLSINHMIGYRVVYGGDVLYEGSQMTHTLAAWDSV